MDRFDHEQLLDYLEGELPPDQAAAVEAALREDPKLARLIEAMRSDRQAMRSMANEPAPPLADDVLAGAERQALLGDGLEEPEGGQARSVKAARRGKRTDRGEHPRLTLGRVVSYAGVAAVLALAGVLIAVMVFDAPLLETARRWNSQDRSAAPSSSSSIEADQLAKLPENEHAAGKAKSDRSRPRASEARANDAALASKSSDRAANRDETANASKTAGRATAAELAKGSDRANRVEQANAADKVNARPGSPPANRAKSSASPAKPSTTESADASTAGQRSSPGPLLADSDAALTEPTKSAAGAGGQDQTAKKSGQSLASARSSTSTQPKAGKTADTTGHPGPPSKAAGQARAKSESRSESAVNSARDQLTDQSQAKAQPSPETSHAQSSPPSPALPPHPQPARMVRADQRGARRASPPASLARKNRTTGMRQQALAQARPSGDQPSPSAQTALAQLAIVSDDVDATQRELAQWVSDHRAKLLTTPDRPSDGGLANAATRQRHRQNPQHNARPGAPADAKAKAHAKSGEEPATKEKPRPQLDANAPARSRSEKSTAEPRRGASADQASLAQANKRQSQTQTANKPSPPPNTPNTPPRAALVLDQSLVADLIAFLNRGPHHKPGPTQHAQLTAPSSATEQRQLNNDLQSFEQQLAQPKLGRAQADHESAKASARPNTQTALTANQPLSANAQAPARKPWYDFARYRRILTQYQHLSTAPPNPLANHGQVILPLRITYRPTDQ